MTEGETGRKLTKTFLENIKLQHFWKFDFLSPNLNTTQR